MAAEAKPRVRMSRDARRAQILEEAVRVIGQQGFNAFSLAELASHCGLTDAGLLHHFQSKDRLLIELLQERDRQDELALIDTMRRLGLQAPTSLAVVRTALHHIAARSAERPGLVRLFVTLRAEGLAPDHPAYEFVRRRQARTRTMFEKMVKPFVPDAQAKARQLIAAMDGLEAQWLAEDLQFDLAQEWDSMGSLLLP